VADDVAAARAKAKRVSAAVSGQAAGLIWLLLAALPLPPVWFALSHGLFDNFRNF
jgi:hypothetical protein